MPVVMKFGVVLRSQGKELEGGCCMYFFSCLFSLRWDINTCGDLLYLNVNLWMDLKL